MNKKLKSSILALGLACSVVMTGCGVKPGPGGDYVYTPNGEGTIQQNYELNYYDNKEYNEFYKEGNSLIEGQWEGYGMGDPFVMRWNGMYYLYVSTENTSYGVRAWKSKDLVNWTQCQGEGLDLGYVCQDQNFGLAAYAPEVTYFDGYFYMYSAPGGNGHRVLRSESPEGPFVMIKEDNYGLAIDGSVFIDDNEDMYFMYASGSGVSLVQLESLDTLYTDKAYKKIQNAQIGGWTEGPGMFKRDGIYYLTYTGTNVISDGYKVCYSISDEGPSDNRSFTFGDNMMLLLDTEIDYEANNVSKGTGHSSTVMGPDMDSYYIAYHTLNSVGGPNRSYALDRLLFNGAQVSTVPTDVGAVAPQMPAIYATDKASAIQNNVLAENGNKLLSVANTANMFTAEFNFTGDDTNLIVSYQNDDNYVYVNVDMAGHAITLNKVTNGTNAQIAEGTLVNDFNANAVHTVRVAYANGVMDVYFDNLCKIDNAAINATAGKIGYSGAQEVYCTACSNVAMGESDKIEVKQAEANIGAATYTTSTSSLSANSKVETLDLERVGSYTNYALAKQMNLAKNDNATYSVKVAKEGFYGLVMTYPKSMGGTKFGVRINQGDVLQVNLPVVNADDDFVTAMVTEFPINKVVNDVSFYSLTGLKYVSFRLEQTSQYIPNYSNSLETYVTRGANYITNWKIAVDSEDELAHFVKANTRSLAYFGDDCFTDVSIEVKMQFASQSSSQSAGLILRAENYAASPSDDYSSIQGYYVYVKCDDNSSVGIDKLNYHDSDKNIAVASQVDVAIDEYFTLKVVIKGNTISIFVDGAWVCEFTDANAFTSGKIGLYTNGASVFYKDITIKGA